MTTRYIWASLCTILLLSCDPSHEASDRQTIPDIPRYDSLDWASEFEFGGFAAGDYERKKRLASKLYQDAWVANHVSGGMLIAQHGRIIYEGYLGMADQARGIQMSAETPLHIASTSKVMTALALLKLVEAEKLHLDDTLTQFWKSFPYPGVTVRHLLAHRSGLPNYLYFTSDPDLWDPAQAITNQNVLDIMMNDKPARASAPGTHFSYNNTNYVLLALLIERFTDMPYPVAMDYILFRPLGMEHTYVMRFPGDTTRASRSYRYGGGVWPYEFLDATYGDKNIYSTPRDMFRLDMAMYSDKFLSEELKEEATKGYSYESKGVKNYGLGIRMMEFDDGGKFLYHNGWWHGNNTVYVRDYNHEAVIIAFGNRYTRSVYAPFSLVTMFGSYALPVDSVLLRQQDSIRLMQAMQDSIDEAAKNPTPPEIIPLSHSSRSRDSSPSQRPPQKDTIYRYASP